MMENIKFNSKNFSTIVKESYEQYRTISWNGHDIKIKKTLSLSEMMSFVDMVTKLCFSEDSGMYIPEVKDFGIKSCILEMYGNFELPEDAEERYELLYCSDAVDVVIKHINNIQLSEIVHSIDVKLEYLSRENIEATHKQMNDLYNAFNNFGNYIESMFAEVSKDDLSKVINLISNGEFEKKIAGTYLPNVVPFNKHEG